MRDQMVIAHVGLHKTGSTALQRDIFPNLPGVKLVRGFDAVRSILPKRSAPTEPLLLISDEAISASPGWTQQMASFEAFSERLEAFHRVFSPTRYLIAFRRHSTWIRSMYCQYLHEGETGSLEEFFSLADIGLLRLGEAPWRRRYECLTRHVGPENVFIYLQEDLLISPDLVVPQLIQFLLPPSLAPSAEQQLRLGKSLGQLRRNASGHLEGYPTLRRLNRLNRPFRHLRIWKTFSRWLERVNLTPRQLCQQSRIPRFWASEMRLDDAEIDSHYLDDFEFIKSMARQSYQQRTAADYRCPFSAAG